MQEPSRSSLTEKDLIVIITFECIGIPFCIAGADNAVHFQWIPTLVGFGVGLALCLFEALFPLLKVGPLKTGVQEWAKGNARWAVPLAVFLALIYVAGP